MTYSLEKQLLKASLLCNLKWSDSPVYRLQLFFVANKDMGSNSHQSDFQRAIETGVDRSKYWKNYDEKGSGEYLFTELGFEIAKRLFRDTKPIYPPLRGINYHVLIQGIIQDLNIKFETRGNSKKSTEVFINNQVISSAKKACKIIERETKSSLPTKGESAVRVLYNFAIDNNFDLIWKGPRL